MTISDKVTLTTVDADLSVFTITHAGPPPHLSSCDTLLSTVHACVLAFCLRYTDTQLDSPDFSIQIWNETDPEVHQFKGITHMVLPRGAVRGAGRPLLERPASLHLAPTSTIPQIQQVLN